MNLFIQETSAKTVQETPPPGQDPLVARGLQKEQYVGMVGLAIALIAAVGFFSRRVEYAIVFAFALSAILIAFFLFV
ncbi:hypothetical protein [Fortiea contorta]|uniref:hypothetical protein n=1 Tax=Fortiea contorta TaxID=1892405 RepID=UPI000345D35C|nr:hypothetical protein [Fortiea contorta]